MNILTPFKDIIPPLAPDEFNQLEKNLLKDGIRDPLVLWGAYLIDGHNRLKIAQKHGLEYKTVDMEFESEDAARIWIINNQIGRRNIEKYVRADLVLELEPLYKAMAKERSGVRTDLVPNEGTRFGKTRDQLAAKAGVGHDTLEKTKFIKRFGSDEIKEKARSGKLSIRKAYLQAREAHERKDAPAQAETPAVTITEKTCSMCGRTLNIGNFYYNNNEARYSSNCRDCTRNRKSGEISPTLKEDIIKIQETVNQMTDLTRVIEYSIEDVVSTLSGEFNRLIRITDDELRNHSGLMQNPLNKEAVVNALVHGVGQIQEKIKEMAGK